MTMKLYTEAGAQLASRVRMEPLASGSVLQTRDSVFNSHFIYKNKFAGSDGLSAADAGICVCFIVSLVILTEKSLRY